MLASAVVINVLFHLHTILNYNFIIFQPLNGHSPLDSLNICSSPSNLVLDLGKLSTSDFLLTREDSLISQIKELMKARSFIEETLPLPCHESPQVDREAVLRAYLSDPNRTLTVTYEDDDTLVRSPREAEGKLVSTNCMLLYFKNARALSSSFAQTSLVLINFTQGAQADCAKSNVTLNFVPSTSSPSFDTVGVELTFEKFPFTWQVSSVTITLVEEKGVKIASVTPDDVSTQNGLAYFCPTTEFTVFVDDDSYTVSFDHFEVQTPSNNNVFYTPRDCRGFVTIPILMGYTVFLVLVFFTVVAVGMLSSMQTIERFDDAKKSTLYIPNQDI